MFEDVTGCPCGLLLATSEFTVHCLLASFVGRNRGELSSIPFWVSETYSSDPHATCEAFFSAKGLLFWGKPPGSILPKCPAVPRSYGSPRLAGWRTRGARDQEGAQAGELQHTEDPGLRICSFSWWFPAIPLAFLPFSV